MTKVLSGVVVVLMWLMITWTAGWVVQRVHGVGWKILAFALCWLGLVEVVVLAFNAGASVR